MGYGGGGACAYVAANEFLPLEIIAVYRADPLARIDDYPDFAALVAHLHEDGSSCTRRTLVWTECYVTLMCIRERVPIPPIHIWAGNKAPMDSNRNLCQRW